MDKHLEEVDTSVGYKFGGGTRGFISDDPFVFIVFHASTVPGQLSSGQDRKSDLSILPFDSLVLSFHGANVGVNETFMLDPSSVCSLESWMVLWRGLDLCTREEFVSVDDVDEYPESTSAQTET